MDTDPARTVGHTGLSGESDFHPAAPAAATPAVAHPGAGPSSAMVTRSRARGGREVNIEPEVECFPEVDIPAETDEGVSGATRHTTDIPEVATSALTTTPIPRKLPTPHTGPLTGMIQPAGRSVTSFDISDRAPSTLSYYGDSPLADSASRARAFVGDDVAIRPHGEVATRGDMAIWRFNRMAISRHSHMAKWRCMAMWQRSHLVISIERFSHPAIHILYRCIRRRGTRLSR